MVGRHEIHEWQWQLVLLDLFPPSKATGRERRDPRQVLNAVFWIEHRRIATRFEKLASSFMAMVKLSFVWRCFRMLERSSAHTRC
jgi:transposase